MPELIFLGSSDGVEDLEPDEDPAHVFPCIQTRGLHNEARAQFYALVTGTFLDEALDMESLCRSLGDEGPTIYALDGSLIKRLAVLDEDEINDYVDLWSETGEIESMELEREELVDFVYLLVSLCQAAVGEETAGIFVYSDA
jgi:hypothetical protein